MNLSSAISRDLPNFTDDLRNNPEIIVNCLGIAMHQVRSCVGLKLMYHLHCIICMSLLILCR